MSFRSKCLKNTHCRQSQALAREVFSWKQQLFYLNLYLLFFDCLVTSAFLYQNQVLLRNVLAYRWGFFLRVHPSISIKRRQFPAAITELHNYLELVRQQNLSFIEEKHASDVTIGSSPLVIHLSLKIKFIFLLDCLVREGFFICCLSSILREWHEARDLFDFSYKPRTNSRKDSKPIDSRDRSKVEEVGENGCNHCLYLGICVNKR